MLKIGDDRVGDILSIYFDEPTATVADETTRGIFVHRSEEDERIVSISIHNVSRRFQSLALTDLPLEPTEPPLTLDELEAEWQAQQATSAKGYPRGQQWPPWLEVSEPLLLHSIKTGA